MVRRKTPIEERFANAQRRWMRLLTEFIQLREKYALLHPMLFDNRVEFQHNVLRKRRGFETLQRSLFLSCCLDIFKLTLDRSSDACMSKSMSDLDDGKLNASLKAHYIAAELKIYEDDEDPVVAAIDRSFATDRAVEFGRAYDERREGVIEAWGQVEQGATFAKCHHIRHNLVAHTRLAGAYFDPIDIRALGIEFIELKPAIDLMQALIEELGGLIHSSGFAWERLSQNLTGAADDFWGVSNMSMNQIVWQSGITDTSR